MTATHQDVSFEDTNGARITVSSELAVSYFAVKGHQLSVLNELIANHAAGYGVSIDANVILALSGLASDLAHANNEFMYALPAVIGAASEKSGNPKAKKGGA